MNVFMRACFLVIAIFLANTGLTQADTITFSDSHLLSPTDWFDTLTVSQFDPTLGTLNSVKISFEAIMASNMTLDNDNSISANVIGTSNVTTVGSFLGLGSLFLNLSASTGVQNLGPDDSGDTDGPGDGGLDEFNAPNLSDADMLMTTLLGGNPDFASFLGLGNLSTVGLGTLGGFGVIGGGGNIDINLLTEAAATLTVQYDFDPSSSAPIPEPSTLLLFGSGLAGLLAWQYRKKQHQ